MKSRNCNLKFGVIGVGCQGQNHLQTLSANPLAELSAVCDIEEQRLKQQADAFDVPLRFTDFNDLLARDDIEAVVIALPDHLHRESTLSALSAGKHVLLEKPMAVSVEDALAIRNAARRSGTCFMINLSNRWMYSFSKGKEILDSGQVGELRYVYARMTNRIQVPTELLPWLHHSHPAHWIGVHRLDIARWWSGSEVVRVRGVQRYGVLRDMDYDAPDFFQAIIEFQNGVVMSLEVHWILPQNYPVPVDSKFYALCSRGVIDIDRVRSELMSVSSDSVAISTPIAGPTLDQQNGFVYAASRHFVDCALTGKKPLVDAEDGLALTRVLCAVVESCKNDGKVVELNPDE
jgi:predicted dehydrogenase